MFTLFISVFRVPLASFSPSLLLGFLLDLRLLVLLVLLLCSWDIIIFKNLTCIVKGQSNVYLWLDDLCSALKLRLW